MGFRIAVVQPVAHRPGNDEANVADAEAFITSAVGESADSI